MMERLACRCFMHTCEEDDCAGWGGCATLLSLACHGGAANDLRRRSAKKG